MIDLDSSSLDLSSPPANLHSDHVTALVSPTDLPSSQCDAHCVEYDIIDDPLDSDDSPPCSIEHDNICDDSVWYHDAEEVSWYVKNLIIGLRSLQNLLLITQKISSACYDSSRCS